VEINLTISTSKYEINVIRIMVKYTSILYLFNIIDIDSVYHIGRTFDQLIITKNSKKSTKGNRRHNQVFGPPTEDYEHWNELKARHHSRPSVAVAGQNLMK
jgi:hypothetical protein